MVVIAVDEWKILFIDFYAGLIRDRLESLIFFIKLLIVLSGKFFKLCLSVLHRRGIDLQQGQIFKSREV